jgi:hypothetical protein
MSQRRPREPSDLRGVAQLARDATLGLSDLVEAMHGGFARPLSGLLGGAPERTRGITAGIYRSIRWITRRVGGGVDAALASLEPVLAQSSGASAAAERRESLVAALNGVLGDHLAATENPLAIPMQFRRGGRALPLAATELAASIPDATGRLVVLIHGLCRSDQNWRRRGHDHGEALARDLGATAVYLRYNSGLHVSTNGRALAEELATLVASWPVAVEELSIVAHSLGGLVARSACHYAGLAGAAWPRQLRHLVFLGTPHHGAPLERGGQWLHRFLGATPYARPLARLGNLRSAGITDLRHGNLLDEDWLGRDRFVREADRRQPVPLPPGVVCCAVAATCRERAGRLHARLIGDGLVPLASALGRHPDPGRTLAFPLDRQWVGRNMSHLELLDRPEVYAQIRAWVGGDRGR